MKRTASAGPVARCTSQARRPARPQGPVGWSGLCWNASPHRDGQGHVEGARHGGVPRSLVTQSGLSAAGLAPTICAWRRTRPSTPAVTIERNGVRVTGDSDDPADVTRIVRALGSEESPDAACRPTRPCGTTSWHSSNSSLRHQTEACRRSTVRSSPTPDSHPSSSTPSDGQPPKPPTHLSSTTAADTARDPGTTETRGRADDDGEPISLVSPPLPTQTPESTSGPARPFQPHAQARPPRAAEGVGMQTNRAGT
ncbi:effector-associated constant component EACC1 [Streptomyces sp. NPDC054844]